MIRRLLPLLLVAAASAQAQANEPAARYLSRQSARPAPAAAPAPAAPAVVTPASASRARATARPASAAPQRVVVQEQVVEQTIVVPSDEARQLETANVLPLALSDEFDFRKRKITVYDRTRRNEIAEDVMAKFDRDRILYGAVTEEERNARQGHYYVFWWRSQRPADVTVRFEYRQANLGNLVQARELDFSVPKGTHEAKFAIIGDDYLDDGKITAWRALVIENNRIVATTQSFLWH